VYHYHSTTKKKERRTVKKWEGNIHQKSFLADSDLPIFIFKNDQLEAL